MSYQNTVSITLTWTSETDESSIAGEISRDITGCLNREFGEWVRAKRGGAMVRAASSYPRITFNNLNTRTSS